MGEINTKLYEVVNDRIEIIKYLYLKTINDYEIENTVKQYFFSKMITLSKSFYLHNTQIMKMDINQSNIESFNKSENQYARKLEVELKKIINEFLKVQTVKVNIKKITIKNINFQLNSDVIHKEFFLNDEIINHLNTFRENKNEINRNLNSEMIKLKSKKYSDELTIYPSENIELLFRIKMRIEKLISEGKTYIMQENSEDQIFMGKINIYFNEGKITFFLKEKAFTCKIDLKFNENNFLMGKMMTNNKDFNIKIYNIEGKTSTEFIEEIGFEKILDEIQEIKTKQMNNEDLEKISKEGAFKLLDELL